MERIYCGPAPLPQELWSSWNFDPVVLVCLAGMTYLLRKHAAGLGAVAILFVAFVSPLCALSSALFSARVVHHVLLIAVAAPLFALSIETRKPATIARPFVVSTVILWGWHLPAAYDLALSNVAVYWLMQVSLLISATWFWRAVLSAEAAVVERIAFIVAAFAQMGMLGAILTFAPTALYAAHALAPLDWGITPLRDQQLGGLIMWVPSGLPYAIAAGVVARRHWHQLTGGAPC
ncbi:MAG: cytochrome c oxidase assembly protein [Rhodobacteraceae bacterium]|nr:cytochrome c oxidase assembly protein [Paracoccaceae bacterium]